MSTSRVAAAAEWYSCSHCKRIARLVAEQETMCPICGAADGEVVPQKRLEESFEAGVYYNEEPGKRKRRRKRPPP
jgi:rRNA maturation endonuclease Nob1